MAAAAPSSDEPEMKAETYDAGYAIESQHPSRAEQNSSKTGRGTPLIPTPTNDRLDPLNWNTSKKNVILAVISIITFLPDFGSSAGIPAFIPQAK